MYALLWVGRAITRVGLLSTVVLVIARSQQLPRLLLTMVVRKVIERRGRRHPLDRGNVINSICYSSLRLTLNIGHVHII